MVLKSPAKCEKNTLFAVKQAVWPEGGADSEMFLSGYAGG
ncbi:hypothetical protein NEIELOOT_00340 [Neisseria elongata subsp. glycolytica ATCC 29315]|uniref:Uncharacterized protein n=1 Tax=Neisseria elongata subsp. glycolytica ATCC 29315 TaxID=546263 RepID=D4DMR6_NEIEG|nr:hypothetical protein NEIELOOT_00340 [Neisseria elongata subsp. glycolytica ATCC 29315]